MAMRLALPTTDEISRRADSIDVLAFLLNFLVAIPFVIGWIAGKAWRGVLLTIASFQLGWRKALGQPSDSS